MTPSEENQREPEGLRSPEGTVIETLEPPRRRSRARRVIQGAGVIVGLGLLGWAVSIAFSEKNRAGLEAIAHAEATDIALLVALTAAAAVINGVLFWISQPCRPHKVPVSDAIAGNIIATVLGVLPFKISVVVRGLIHHKRNHVRFGELAAWFMAIGLFALATLLPVGAATLWRRDLDALWWAASIGGVTAAGVCGVILGKIAGASPYRILHRLTLGADRIVRDPVVMAINLSARFGDVLLFSWRFQVAGRIVGVDLPFEQAALLGAGYFLIVVLAPSGPLGFAEMGVAGLASMVGLDPPSIALLALVITGASVMTSGTLAIPSAMWLRVDKVFGPRAQTPARGAPAS